MAMAMTNEGQVLIARYMKNIDPNKDAKTDVDLVALIAPPQDNGSLLMHRIPCIEDFRNFPFPHMTSIDKILPCQKDAVSEYIRCMTVPYESTNEDSLLAYNAPLLSVLHAAQRRALSDTKVYQLNGSMLPKGDIEGAKAAIKMLRENFPMEYIEQQGSKKRKMYWADGVVINTEEGTGITAMDANAGADVISTTASSSSASSSSSAMSLEITVQNPVEDFEKFVRNYPNDSENLTSAFKKMTEIINELVSGGNNAYFRRAIESLKSLRASILSTKGVCSDGHSVYNTFLKDIVKQYSRDYVVFWDNFFVKEGVNLTLISTGEVPASMISHEEAQIFLREEAPATAVPSAANQADDPMFDDLE